MCTDLCVHVCARAYVHVYVHVYMRVYVRVCVHVSVCACVCVCVSVFYHSPPYFLKQGFLLNLAFMESLRIVWAAEMAQQLRELTALPEDPSSVLSTHVAAHSHL